MSEGPTTGAIAAEVRRLGARVSQLEDSIGIYGPPPKARRLPIPEVTPAQREFLVWVALFTVISIVTAAVRGRGGGE